MEGAANSRSVSRNCFSVPELCGAFAKIVVKNKRNRIAFHQLKVAAEKQHAVAKGLLAHVLLSQTPFQDLQHGERMIDGVLEELVRERAEGNDGVELCLGLCHLWGHGTEQDLEEAKVFLEPLCNRSMPWVKSLLDSAVGSASSVSQYLDTPPPDSVARVSNEEESKEVPPHARAQNTKPAGVAQQEGRFAEQARIQATTQLPQVAKQGDLAACKRLLLSRAKVNNCDERGRTPLYLAACEGHQEVCAWLLERNAAVDLADEHGWTPLMVACWYGQHSVCQILLDNHAALDVVVREGLCEGENALFLASMRGHGTVCQLLIDRGMSVNQVSSKGLSPLYAAAVFGQQDTCALLLNNGAIVNLSKSNGVTPLFVAAQEGHVEACRVLCEHGADVNMAREDDGWTPLDIAQLKDREEVCTLLKEKGARPGKWGTALYHAAENGSLEECKALIARGADVDEISCWDNTPLFAAAKNGHYGVCKLLLTHFATVDKGSGFGLTPLYIAAKLGHRSVCELLLEHGADPMHQTKYCKKPADVAAGSSIRDLFCSSSPACREYLQNFQGESGASGRQLPSSKSTQQRGGLTALRGGRGGGRRGRIRVKRGGGRIGGSFSQRNAGWCTDSEVDNSLNDGWGFSPTRAHPEDDGWAVSGRSNESKEWEGTDSDASRGEWEWGSGSGSKAASTASGWGGSPGEVSSAADSEGGWGFSSAARDTFTVNRGWGGGSGSEAASTASGWGGSPGEVSSASHNDWGWG